MGKKRINDVVHAAVTQAAVFDNYFNTTHNVGDLKRIRLSA